VKEIPPEHNKLWAVCCCPSETAAEMEYKQKFEDTPELVYLRTSRVGGKIYYFPHPPE